MFPNSDIPIVNETDSEIKFDYHLAGMVSGEFGVFSKSTGHLRLDINQGEYQKVTHHLWGGSMNANPSMRFLIVEVKKNPISRSQPGGEKIRWWGPCQVEDWAAAIYC